MSSDGTIPVEVLAEATTHVFPRSALCEPLRRRRLEFDLGVGFETTEFKDFFCVQEVFHNSCCCVELRCDGRDRNNRLSPRERIQRKSFRKDFARGLALPAFSGTSPVAAEVSDQLDATIQFRRPRKSIGGVREVSGLLSMALPSPPSKYTSSPRHVTHLANSS